MRAYDTDLSQFVEFLAGRACGQAERGARSAHSTPTACAGFSPTLHDRGLSRASAARRLAALGTFARYLVREDILAEDPTTLVGAPQKEQTLPAHLGSRDMDRLLAAPDVTTPAGRRDRAILELFYASGLRLSELVGNGFGDVNLGGRMSRVRGKGGKERLVPFNHAAADAMRAMLKDATEPGCV